ncbi:MAG: acetylglutamate kinase [Gammaproteobacteria bacterium]|nr:acetylglutamate kinase [Gammaproteobacteria bacterium]
MLKQPLVLKVGGALLESKDAQAELFNVIAKIMAQGIAVVLVHGGGCLVEQWLKQAGMASQKINGLRVTPVDQIDLIVGALAGAANKKLVAQAKANKINAVGLSLADGDMVTANILDPKLGLVGECQVQENTLLTMLMAKNYLPIISSIANDDGGNLLNVNADLGAQVIAQLLGAKLVLLSDVPGVLDGDKQLISQLSRAYADQLVAGNVIVGGMMVKVDAAFDTAQQLNDSIVIASWKEPAQLLQLIDGNACGTTIKPNYC